MIYENVLRLCKEKRISISRLERELCLGNATIRKWKNCSPRLDRAKMVADYFHISVDELIK